MADAVTIKCAKTPEATGYGNMWHPSQPKRETTSRPCYQSGLSHHSHWSYVAIYTLHLAFVLYGIHPCFHDSTLVACQVDLFCPPRKETIEAHRVFNSSSDWTVGNPLILFWMITLSMITCVGTTRTKEPFCGQ